MFREVFRLQNNCHVRQIDFGMVQCDLPFSQMLFDSYSVSEALDEYLSVWLPLRVYM